ncbi:MAG TPA: hypothetical protein VMV95_03830 [Bacillota bacterium]|nr:hypothetical protein [Bacillota bacterium]
MPIGVTQLTDEWKQKISKTVLAMQPLKQDNRQKGICLTCGKEFKYYPCTSSGLFCSRLCYYSNDKFLKKTASKGGIALSKIKGSQSNPKASDKQILESWEKLKANKSLSLREEFSKHGYARTPKKLIKLIGKEEYDKYVEKSRKDKNKQHYFAKNKKRRGYEAELKAKWKLQKEGFLVIRSSASLTPFDLVALREDKIKLVQVKREKLKGSSYHKDIQKMEEVKVPKNCSKELWIWRDRKGWIIKKLGKNVTR